MEFALHVAKPRILGIMWLPQHRQEQTWFSGSVADNPQGQGRESVAEYLGSPGQANRAPAVSC